MKLAFDPQVAYPRLAAGNESRDGQKDPEGLKQLCQDFESIFIHTLFKEMRQTIPEGGYLEKGQGEEMFQDVMDMEVARNMARKGGLGLGRLIYENFQSAAKSDKKSG
ncbi:MAG: rod-binding protein [Thermodesulfobacteriota bacterium]